MLHHVIKIAPQRYAITPLQSLQPQHDHSLLSLTAWNHFSGKGRNHYPSLRPDPCCHSSCHVYSCSTCYSAIEHGRVAVLLIISKRKQGRKVRCQQWQRQQICTHTWTPPDRTTNKALDCKKGKWMQVPPETIQTTVRTSYHLHHCRSTHSLCCIHLPLPATCIKLWVHRDRWTIWHFTLLLADSSQWQLEVCRGRETVTKKSS